MPRTPDEIYAEIAALPLADRLRLAARIVEEAARLAQAGSGSRPAAPAASSAAPAATAPPPATPGRAVTSPPPPAQVPTPELRRLIIVDGSNFLGTIDGYNLASDASREGLITRLQDYVHAHPSFRIVAYFDGQKSSVKRAAGVEVRYTPRDPGGQGTGGADFFIRQALKAMGTEERAHTVLVTADRELADAARKLGAKVEAPTSFNSRIPAVRRTTVTERGLSPNEVAAWEDYFSQPPDSGPKKR